MHQETADKLNACDLHRFPPPGIFVILNGEDHVFIIYGDDPVVADSDSVSIFAEIVDD